MRLRVPPELMRRARREAEAIERMPTTAVGPHLARRRDEESVPSYPTLRRDVEALSGQAIFQRGHPALVRSAGHRLWIVVLQTRQVGARFTDPVYVLSAVPVEAAAPEDPTSEIEVDGWIVGERTIGRHALPLIIAYSVREP